MADQPAHPVSSNPSLELRGDDGRVAPRSVLWQVVFGVTFIHTLVLVFGAISMLPLPHSPQVVQLPSWTQSLAFRIGTGLDWTLVAVLPANVAIGFAANRAAHGGRRLPGWLMFGFALSLAIAAVLVSAVAYLVWCSPIQTRPSPTGGSWSYFGAGDLVGAVLVNLAVSFPALAAAGCCFIERLRPPVYEGPPVCRACGYDLRGSVREPRLGAEVGVKCPECGELFVDTDLNSSSKAAVRQ